MKVLFLTNHLNGDDGYSRYSLNFIQEIQKLGHQVLVLTSRKSFQNKITERPILGKPLGYLVNIPKIVLASIKIRREIKKFSPDIIHFMVEPYVNFLPFLGGLKAKTYLTCHGTYTVIPNLLDSPFKKKISQLLSKEYFQKLTGVITVSNYTKNYLLKHHPTLANKVKVVINGIDLEENKPIIPERKTERDIKQILFVGAIKERKGLIEAVEACRYYRDHFSDKFIYNIIGDYKSNGYSHKLSERIKAHKLDDKVFLRGKTTPEDLRRYYLEADLFLMPSLNIDHNFEGFGLVFLEANANGVPCIGSTNSGCQEAILEGKTGYLVDPFNFKQIAERMDSILNLNSINKENCITWAKENNIRIKTKELVDFYQKA